MKQNKTVLSHIIACFIAAATLAGCTWDSSLYDDFVNPSLDKVIACYGYCDTTPESITQEQCDAAIQAGATATWKDGKCQINVNVLTEAQCKKITNKPYYRRLGITLPNGVYAYQDPTNSIYYCGTYDEVGPSRSSEKSEDAEARNCENYIKTHDLGFSSFEAFKAYFEKMTQDPEDGGYSLCPANTLSCSPLHVQTLLNESDTIGFCNACEKDSAICDNQTMKCTPINTNERCGSCDNNCSSKNKICIKIQNGEDSKYDCSTITCPPGQHYGQNGCTLNTITACGDAGNCLEKAIQLGWENTQEPTNDSEYTGYCGYIIENTNAPGAVACTKEQSDAIHECVRQITNDPNYNVNDETFKADIKRCFQKCKTDLTTITAACLATKCRSGYEINHTTRQCEPRFTCEDKDTYYLNGECRPNDSENCGTAGYACKDKIAGWIDGECKEGRCEATKCDTGYEPIDGRCEAKTSCIDPNTHYYDGACIPNNLENCGQHAYACAANIAGWINGECKEGKCEATKCDTGYELIDGRCEARTSCTDPNTHYYNGECIKNDMDNCGKHNNKCSDITGWANGTCKEGVCTPSDCQTGYHLDAGSCVADDNNNCGRVNNPCGLGEVCTQGECQDNCGSGEVRCEKDGIVSCANPNTSTTYCGADETCSKYEVCQNGQACVDKKCVQTACTKENETLCVVSGETKCIAIHSDNDEHCGACNLKCSDRSMANASSTTCLNGQCQYTCATDYTNCGTSTVPNCIKKENLKNDPNNCGTCGTKCNADELCSNGTCKKSTCTNQCLVNGACVNKNDACGVQCTDCNSANFATSGTCSASGTCTITACIAGYHLTAEKTCAQNTATACGSPNGTDVVNCIDKDSTHATEAYCNADAQCVATSCEKGYHLENKRCVEDTETACGATVTDCTTLEGVMITEENAVQCLNGKCNATACLKDYHLAGEDNEKKCVQDSPTVCGDSQTNCHEIAHAYEPICRLGTCYVIECEDGYAPNDEHNACVCDEGACQADKFPWVESAACNADKTACLLSCPADQHLSPDNTSCVDNTDEACAPQDANTPENCTDIDESTHIANRTCQSGACKIAECQPGYHIATEEGLTCEANTNTACAPVNSSDVQSCANPNPKCGDAGECCRATSNTETNTKPNCCEANTCRKKRNENRYKCSTSTANRWDPC